MQDREENKIKTFNTAKKFAEEILFPIMSEFKKFQRQAYFGASELSDAKFLPIEVREIERYNGLKGMCETTRQLIKAISSTVRIKGKKAEIEQLDKLSKTLQSISENFYERKHLFFTQAIEFNNLVEKLDRKYFDNVKDIVEKCYENTEMLMTENKMLFAHDSDEYMDDAEIKDSIKEEYIDG